MLEDFDVEIFGRIMNARVNAIDGKMLDAKKHLVRSQWAIEEKYQTPPIAFIPDSIKVMYDLGEFEDALKLQEVLKNSEGNLDPNSRFLLSKEQHNSKQNFANYQQFNREGIKYYQQGKYEQAKAAFALAQGFAPVNTGVTLNLLQCLLQLLLKSDKPSREMMLECRKLFKLIDDMPLKQQHAEKYQTLRQELDQIIG